MNRVGFIGGSDIGAILGVSKWKTPLVLFLEKTGQYVEEIDEARERMFRRGKRFEPIVVEMLTEERGLEIIARNKRYEDPEFPHFSCEIDAEAMVDGEHVNVEIKTSHPFAAAQWGEEGTDEIDVSYAAQAMWGLMITGRRKTIFGVLIGADNLVTYEVVRDDDTIKGMRAAAIAFWNDHVLTKTPPEPVNFDDTTHLFDRGRSTTIQADDRTRLMVQSYRKMKDSIAFYEEGAEVLKFQIAEAMLGAEAMANKDKPGRHVLMDGARELLTVSLQEQERVDTGKLRDLYPKIAKEVGKVSKFFNVRLSRKKQ